MIFNGITFECGASVYSKIGSIFSSTLYSDDLNELYEKRDAFIEKYKDGAEMISFGEIVVTAKSIMKNTEKVHKLIKGDYTNKYITSLNKKQKS